MNKIAQWANTIISSVERAVYGKTAIIERLLVALLARGHVLIEDVPGIGKTILARALAKSLGGNFKRIQCTPDLLPTDILGVSVYNPKDNVFFYRKGPILANFLLVDEINRATPRTQSALLEAMAEGQISIEGKTMSLLNPFFLVATENPIEFEGTFTLPEAQRDRFTLFTDIGYPDIQAERDILTNQNRFTHPVQDIEPVTDLDTLLAMQQAVLDIHVHPELKNYILTLVDHTRTDNRIKLGVSPRGTLALYRCSQALAAIRGRDYVIPEDIKELANFVFFKRLILKTDVALKGYTAKNIIEDILVQVNVPVVKDKA